VKDTLAKVDQFEADALKRSMATLLGRLECTERDHTATALRLRPGFITELDLKGSGISTVLWATGYNFDFSLVKLPIVDADGYPIQKRGVTDYQGLYFLECLGFTANVGNPVRCRRRCRLSGSPYCGA